MVDTNRAARFNRILELERFKELDKDAYFYGDNYALAVYQNGKFLGYKNPGKLSSIVLNASFPKVKAGFLGLGKCKDIDIYVLNTKEYEFKFSLSSRAKNGKSLMLSGMCKFSITDIDIEKYLKWSEYDPSSKYMGYTGAVISLEQMQKLISETYLKACLDIVAKDYSAESSFSFISYPKEKLPALARDMEYFVKLRLKNLGLTATCQVTPN